MKFSILNVISSKQLPEIIRDLSEAELDQNLEDGLLKSIPIIGTAKRIYDLVKSLQESFFEKKLKDFLNEMKDIPFEARESFFAKINNYGNDYKRIGERILNLIDKVDSEEKAKIIGKLLGACILEKISIDDYFRLTTFIDKAYLGDLWEIKKHNNAHQIKHISKEQLYTVGLLKIKISNRQRSFSKWGRKSPKKSGSKQILDSTDFAPESVTDYEYNLFAKILKDYGF